MILILEQKNIKHPTTPLIRKIAIFVTVFLFTVIHLSAQTDTLANLPQFLLPHFTTTVMKLKTGVSLSAIMNYNTLTGKMTFYQNGTFMDLNKPETVDTIYLQEKKFVFIEKAFYEVLVSAYVSLFIQYRSDLRSSGRPAGYGTTSQTIGPTSVSTLYSSNNNSYNLKLPENYKVTPSQVNWIRMNNVMYRFQTERQFLKIFPAKENEIKQFIDKFKLNLNEKDDLIRLVNYCNGL
jgi:hypothetical protein